MCAHCNIISVMLKYSWNKEKNKLLKETRNIGYEQIVEAIQHTKTLASLKHTNTVKYKNQKIFVIEINNYAYCVPYVKRGSHIFFKTIYPSRKYNKIYLKGEK